MAGWTLYEIDGLLQEALQAAFVEVNEETGEISEDWYKFLDDVQMARDKKVCGVAAYIKNVRAEAAAVKAEKAALAKRQTALENKDERLTNYLAAFLTPGEKPSDGRVAIGWRESSRVVVLKEEALPESCIKVVKTTSLTDVKAAILRGEIDDTIARIEKKQNLQIK